MDNRADDCLLDRRLGLEGRSTDWRHNVAGNGAVAAERSTSQISPSCRHPAREALRRLLGPGYSDWNVPASVSSLSHGSSKQDNSVSAYVLSSFAKFGYGVWEGHWGGSGEGAEICLEVRILVHYSAHLSVCFCTVIRTCPDLQYVCPV